MDTEPQWRYAREFSSLRGQEARLAISYDSKTPVAPDPLGKSDELCLPALTIAWHSDVARIGERAILWEIPARGRTLALARQDLNFAPVDSPVAQPLNERFLSRRPLFFSSAGADGIKIDGSGSGTTLVIDGKAASGVNEFNRADLERGVVLLLASRVVLVLHYHRPHLASVSAGAPILGQSDCIRRLRSEIAALAEFDMPVLLRGETGTGKELAASAIHQASRRASMPYLALNMAAVPPELAPAELFGAAAGAYTGARAAQQGYFRRATGGTLFLDEVGAMSMSVQAMLLRTLESGEIQTLGDSRPEKVNVRILAATDVNVEELIDSGVWRAPLYHRLAGYILRVPSLRDRREDLGVLLLHFLREELATIGRVDKLQAPEGDEAPWMPAALVAELVAGEWPGNVRQLKNVARELVISSLNEHGSSPSIRRDPPEMAVKVDPGASAALIVASRPCDLTEEDLERALEQNQWQMKATAAHLGISRSTLYTLIDKSKRIRKASDLTDLEIEQAQAAFGRDVPAMARRLRVSPDGLRRRLRALED